MVRSITCCCLSSVLLGACAPTYEKVQIEKCVDALREELSYQPEPNAQFYTTTGHPKRYIYLSKRSGFISIDVLKTKAHRPYISTESVRYETDFEIEGNWKPAIELTPNEIFELVADPTTGTGYNRELREPWRDEKYTGISPPLEIETVLRLLGEQTCYYHSTDSVRPFSVRTKILD